MDLPGPPPPCSTLSQLTFIGMHMKKLLAVMFVSLFAAGGVYADEMKKEDKKADAKPAAEMKKEDKKADAKPAADAKKDDKKGDAKKEEKKEDAKK
jgi:hypothetical protein